MFSHRLIVLAAVLAALVVSMLPLAPGGALPVQAGTSSPADEHDKQVQLMTTSGARIAGKDGVTNPVLIDSSKVMPSYPESARVEKTSGKVILEALIDKEGIVQKVKAVKVEPKGQKDFVESAVKAVKQWRYEPAMAEGKPVDVVFTVMVTFELK